MFRDPSHGSTPPPHLLFCSIGNGVIYLAGFRVRKVSSSTKEFEDGQSACLLQMSITLRQDHVQLTHIENYLPDVPSYS